MRQHDHHTAYTSDQALQDYAGSDIRRSRRGEEHYSPTATRRVIGWAVFCRTLPASFLPALNVPIHEGCLLDVNLVLADAAVGAEEINQAMRGANLPGICRRGGGSHRFLRT